jgi:hypothetical protein
VKDWRVAAIWAVVLIALGATTILLAGGYWQQPNTFIGSVFASWVAGLALFTVVGLVVALVSLARPEQESFDARARILFRQQSGKHIDYIIKRIGGVLAHYNENTSIKVIVSDYHAEEKKLLITCESKTEVKSYIDDITSTVISRIKLKNVTPPPSGGVSNRILFLRVDKSSLPALTRDFIDQIDLPYNVTVEPNSSSEIERCTHLD